MIRKRTLVIELVHFEFKISLIRLGLTSLKNTDSESGFIAITLKSQLSHVMFRSFLIRINFVIHSNQIK